MTSRTTTNEDLRDLIDRNHHDGQRRFEALEKRDQEILQRLDVNDSRIVAIESELLTQDDVSDMIQQCLTEFADKLPEIVRATVSDAIKESKQISERNAETLAEVKETTDKLAEDTAPLVEICQTVKSVRKGLIWVAAPAGALMTLAAALTVFGWLT